ncbi:MAG TPA: hypothetical protein PKY77_23340 [Phycisphaerae bacterium]|nr:hypothetical protein [Phycisphaerae bacterium]HRY69247.1 hypothetical protein [Phycisphaerae bacterium]HSA26565.1 hypothetical protein [Phycisphaerae bacterium]
MRVLEPCRFRWIVLLSCAGMSAVAVLGAESVQNTASEFAGDSASIQKALDAAAAQGGAVRLEAGRYNVDRAISIPEGVTLAGVWEGPHHSQLKRGTILEITADHGNENGPAAITLNPSSTVRGITVFYPRQRVPDIVPYPWTVQGKGMHNNVIDCTFVNPHKMIDFGTHANELHYIRNCLGCPLKIGVHIDRCTDIGRIENVHFNPHYWSKRTDAADVPDWGALSKYLWEHLVAFEFARTDWEYVHNTFCYGARIGYHFHESKAGTANGNFLGIGADWCHRALVVEQSQSPGLLITNGEFVGGTGGRALMEVTATHTGVIQLSNCAFWGPCEVAAILDGTGTTSLSQCNFLNVVDKPTGVHLIQGINGDLTVQACRFGFDRPAIQLGKEVRTAVIAGNRFVGRKSIENNSTGDVQEGLNVVRKRAR